MKRFTLGRNISYCLSSSGIIYHERGQSEATAGGDWETDEICTWICQHLGDDQPECELQGWHL